MTSALQSDLASRPVEESITELDTRSKHTSTSADRSHAVGPFGVLDFTGTQQPADESLIAIPEQSPESTTVPADIPDTTSPHTDLSLESLNSRENFLEWPDLFELDFVSPDFAPSDIGYALLEGSLQIDDAYQSGQLTYPQQAFPNQNHHQQSCDLPPTNRSAPETSLRGILPADARILLKHFNDQVIAQFSSLPPGVKPHWTIFNVRSAVLTLANITYMQTPCISNASVANLMALLAMSARHLAHQNVTQHIQTVSDWRNISDSAFQYAKEHLQYSLKKEIQGTNRAKYKDQVMAISAMLAFAVRGDLVPVSPDCSDKS